MCSNLQQVDKLQDGYLQVVVVCNVLYLGLLTCTYSFLFVIGLTSQIKEFDLRGPTKIMYVQILKMGQLNFCMTHVFHAIFHNVLRQHEIHICALHVDQQGIAMSTMVKIKVRPGIFDISRLIFTFGNLSLNNYFC